MGYLSIRLVLINWSMEQSVPRDLEATGDSLSKTNGLMWARAVFRIRYVSKIWVFEYLESNEIIYDVCRLFNFLFKRLSGSDAPNERWFSITSKMLSEEKNQLHVETPNCLMTVRYISHRILKIILRKCCYFEEGSLCSEV